MAGNNVAALETKHVEVASCSRGACIAEHAVQSSIFLNGSDAKAGGCVPCRSGMWRAGCNAKVLCKTGASRALTALRWATVFVVDLHLSGHIVTQQSHMYDTGTICFHRCLLVVSLTT